MKLASIFVIIFGIFYFCFRIFGVKKKKKSKEKKSASVELYFEDGSRLVISPDSPYYNDFQKYADELMRREKDAAE